VANKPKSLF
jgi:hypothetical protein